MRQFTAHPAIRAIQSEHDNLAAVIHGMLFFARSVTAGGPVPDAKVFRAMLLYIRDFPDRVHHPKEDAFLFARLRARTHAADAAIEELERQHGQGEHLVRALEDALTRYELGDAQAGKAFCEQVERYASFYFSHMKREEEEIIPLALEVFTPEDWQAVNAAFAEHRDPLSGAGDVSGMDRLFSKIVEIAPAPIGLGAAP